MEEGYDADYTRVIRTLELGAGVELHSSATSTSQFVRIHMQRL